MSRSLIKPIYGILWKNLLIKWRHYFSTPFEIAVPILLCLLINRLASPNGENTENGIRKVPVLLSNEADFKSYNFTLDSNDRNLCFSPNTSESFAIMEYVRAMLESDLMEGTKFELKPFKDESEVNKAMLPAKIESGSWVPSNCLVFDDLSALREVNGSYRYKWKSNSSIPNLWEDDAASVPVKTFHKPNDAHKIQYLVNLALLNERKDRFNLDFTEAKQIETRRIPFPAHVQGSNRGLLGKLLPLIIPFCFIVSLTLTVNRICSEKESMSRELLKMNGLSDAAYWTANIIFNLIYFTIISLIVTILLKTTLKNSNFFVLLVGFVVFSTLLILTGMILTVICGSPKLTSTLSACLIILPYALNRILNNEENSTRVHVARLLCGIPIMGLDFLIKIVAKFEDDGRGMTWKTISTQVDEIYSLSYLSVVGLMLLSVPIHLFLLWYLDKVWPFQPGVAQSFYFFLTKGYWIPGSSSKSNSKSTKKATGHKKSSFFEEEPSKPVAIECHELRKTFSGSCMTQKKVAVDGIDLNVYQGEITCLLGHNGAGKTTTMNMITGMYRPSKGSIRVNGYDLISQTAKARSSMSLCPQHNALYEELTVREHLYLYACIKGYSLVAIQDEINGSLLLTGMAEQSNKRPKQLSGGMKRKLCLGIALVGGSQILILDEPSSGLDTESRRIMWDTLKRVRQNRTILLTTHDMEEADALADRIVIMHEGHVVCAGTSMFLKKKLATGYSLAISKGPQFQGESTFLHIKKYLPQARVKLDMGSEITYELRENSKTKKYMSALFKELEANAAALGINSYGVAVATLDDVFMKIGEVSAGSAGRHGQRRHSKGKARLLKQSLDCPRKTGSSLLICQLNGLIIKRFNNAKRSWKLLAYQIILPCLIFFFAFWCSAGKKPLLSKLTAVRDINLDLYPDAKVALQIDDSYYASKFKEYLKVILDVDPACHKLIEVPSDVNMSDFFVSQMKDQETLDYLRRHVVGLTVKQLVIAEVLKEPFYDITAWVNLQAPASVQVAIDLIQQTQSLEQLRQDGSLSNRSRSGIYAGIQEVKEPVYLGFLNVLVSLPWMIFIPLSFTFLASSYVIFPVLERASKAKLIQMMSGLNPITFHLGSFVFDLTNHFIISVLLICWIYSIDLIYGNKYFIHNFADAISILLLLVSFGAACIAICYLLAFCFSADGRAFVIISIIHVITGVILSIIFSIWQFLKKISTTHQSGFDKFFTFAQISPIFSITSGFRKIFDNNAAIRHCASLDSEKMAHLCSQDLYMLHPSRPCCTNLCRNDNLAIDECKYDNPLGWSGNRILPEVMSLLLIFLVCTLLVLILELFGRSFSRIFNCFGSGPARQFVDSDVLAEEARVEKIIDQGQYNKVALTVYNIFKRFGNFYAVRGLSFTVHKQECFGLLGVNGAGKSTTFGILTGDLTPNEGDVFQEDIQLSQDKRLYQENVGFCPQFDPIIDNLSGEEMIYLYGRLRGISGRVLSLLANEMIKLMDLQDHASRASGTYSGGNKRKLSIALAMIGNPKLVFLDEPTAGLDPSARKKIWTSLSAIREQLNCSMILTSHSMGECEALCSRIAIMVRGEFVCLGSPQHLKSKFGHGYTVLVKVKRANASDENYLASFAQDLANQLPGSSLADFNDNIFVLRVPESIGKLSQLFDLMENLKKRLDLEDYTIGNTSLEQVFIQFAKHS